MSISFTASQALFLVENENRITFIHTLLSGWERHSDVARTTFEVEVGERILVQRALARFEREFVAYQSKQGFGIGPVREYHRLLIKAIATLQAKHGEDSSGGGLTTRRPSTNT